MKEEMTYFHKITLKINNTTKTKKKNQLKQVYMKKEALANKESSIQDLASGPSIWGKKMY